MTDTPNNVSDIYVPFGTDFTNNGTVNANIVMEAAPTGWNPVKVINNGVTIYSGYVADNGSFELPTPDSRNGYTFGGWRCGNTVYKAGETVKVTSDMTFTAIWNAINIPDTYDIDLVVGEGGEAKTNFSNASAGTTITITVTPDEGYELDYITVDGERISGTSFKMPDHDVTVRVYFTDGTSSLPFTDVSAGQWFYDAVAYVYTNGMMEGDSATTFNPDGTMTRAMFWAVLGRIDGATITGTNWADQAREWAMAEGVSDGTDPNGLVTREQMVTMLYRYAVAKGYDVSIGESTNILSYADFGQISEYAIPAMQWGCGSGVITGVTESTLVPQGTATRAQCAAIFMRFDQM
ncbi:MAG TPA: S-layer homology domain-containing protein [Candidatus Scatomorpha pullicola]|nr:S-layer homology domain-containing protein [Candidatus Scatomorpha pullicola]